MSGVIQLEIECVRGNDLVAKTKCTCAKYPDDKILKDLKTEIKLWGYNDANFFDNVNKEPREGACNCGRKFVFQWKRDYVDFSFLN